MELIDYNGWSNCIRLSNDLIEVIITTQVGPRIIRFAVPGGANMLKEVDCEQGGTGESEWKIRGGHRLWVAPEESYVTYEPDNSPVRFEQTSDGVRLFQEKGCRSGIEKAFEITLKTGSPELVVRHFIKNSNTSGVTIAPWAITVMAGNGMAIIPLPEKIPHTDRLTHNQEWSLWSYTDLADKRWKFGTSYVCLAHDSKKGPTKMGFVHRGDWSAYALEELLFVKQFKRLEACMYPDGGVNLEVFANEQFLEIESLGPLSFLKPGEQAQHVEKWGLYRIPEIIGPDSSESRIHDVVSPVISENLLRQ